MRKLAALALVWLACEPVNGSSTTSVRARATNGECPSPLEGQGSPGDGCEKFSDCREVCCTCPDGGRGYAGASCVDGRCASTAAACEKSLQGNPVVCQ